MFVLRFVTGQMTKQIKAMPIDAPQVAAAHGDAVAIEEFKNLDRDLAAVVDAVAELRGGERTSRGKTGNDINHLGDGAAQEEMVVRHFIDLAHAAEKLEKPAHIRFWKS